MRGESCVEVVYSVRPRPSTLAGCAPGRAAAPPVGATLKQPETISDPAVRPSAVIAPPTLDNPNPAAPAAAQDQYEQLQSQLAQRGVAFQSLEGPDEQGAWHFRC